jgi:two-component system chemotaxis response regulator CheB
VAIKVLIADDSAYIRKVIYDILIENKTIEIIDQAKNGIETVEMVRKYKPDVLLLDLVMPEMNGLDAFENIMSENPVPTIILSAISPQNMDTSMQALIMGAFDYVIKPGGLGASDLPNFRKELLNKVLNASQPQISKVLKDIDLLNRKVFLRQEPVSETFEFGKYLQELKPADEDIEKSVSSKSEIKEIMRNSDQISSVKSQKVEGKPPKINIEEEKQIEIKREEKIKSVHELDLTPVKDVLLTSNIVLLGASVGGPRAIRNILKELPKELSCPILIVQHLNESFVETFVNTLGRYCKIKIKVAENGEHVQSGIVYVAPGNQHMEISVKNKKPIIKTYKGKPYHHCMPSIDILFYSAARVYKNLTMGILLTGMGDDGVTGLAAIKKFGGVTIAESQDTSVVFGMPKLAIERGFADLVIPGYDIHNYIKKFAKYNS